MTIASVLLRQSPFLGVQQYFLTHGCHLQPETAAPERKIIIDLTFGQLSALDIEYSEQCSVGKGCWQGSWPRPG